MEDKTKKDADYVAPVIGEEVNSGENQDYDYPADQDTKPVDFPEPDWSADNPIPVYQVDRPQIPDIVEWSSNRITIVDQPVQIIGANRNRLRALIQNEGGGAVYIGPDMSVSTAMAYKLNVAANYTIEMTHNSDVWARCAAGDSAVVNVLQEYTVNLDNAKHHV